MKIKRSYYLYMIFALLVPYLTGCSDAETKSRSMEQIYAEDGVPVRVMSISKGSFNVELTYNAVLSGIKESIVAAMYGDRIEKIHVNVGDYVYKDQVLISFPDDNPSANYYQAKVAYENSKKMLERYENLYETGGVSLQTLDNIRTQFRVDEANWEAVRQTIKLKAPISGYVTRINVRETDNVRREDPLMTIARTSTLKAKIHIAERDIALIEKGVTAEAEWNGKTLTGEVVQVDLAMDPVTKSFTADIEFPNSENEFPAGITAGITILAASKNDVISVDRKHLVSQGEQYYAFVAVDGKAKMVPVKTGIERGVRIEITDGLKEGDLLITEGLMFLENDTKLNIIE